jgi:hypothetical protein
MEENKIIAMYDLEGNLLDVFETNNLAELSNSLNVDRKGLYSCLNNTVNQINGKQFKEIIYKNKVLKKIGDITEIKNTCKPVAKIYNGKTISIYSDIETAAIKNKITPSNISSCLKGKRKTTKLFEWKYV